MGSMNTLIQNQHQYLYNRDISKKLCLELELRITELNYYQKKYDHPQMERLNSKIEQLHLRLDVIWSQQIDLYFRIKKQEDEEPKAITTEDASISPDWRLVS